MYNPLIESSDPQTTVTVTKHPASSDLAHSSGNRIQLRFAVNETVNSAVPANQQRAVCVFAETLDAVRFSCERVEFWWSRFPLPQSIFHSRPEIALPVFVQIEGPAAQTAVVSKALHAAFPNCAEPPRRYRHTAGPYRAFVIFEDLEKITPGKFLVLSELAVFPACKAFCRSNPESSVTRDEQTKDKGGRKLLISRRAKSDTPHTVETKQSGFSTQPEIAVGCLSNRGDQALRKAFADFP